MVKNAFIRLLALIVLAGFCHYLLAVPRSNQALLLTDSLVSSKGSFHKDSAGLVGQNLELSRLSLYPYLSVQQLLKGNVAGVYVQENNGEPGVMQSTIIRGMSSPVFSNKDVSGNQPVVFLNGVPLLTDNSFVYGIKSTDVNPIGTGTNILAGLNLNDVESIEVVKDAAELAKLGPLAANGAILIKMKDGYYGGDNVFVRASGGMSIQPGKVEMTNAANERAFRMQFVEQCANERQRTAYLSKMPAWMNDLRDLNFYGNPDWADDYYSMAPLYNLGASIGGGGKRANYIFMIGYTGNNGVADNTKLGKLVTNIALNMTLAEKFGMSCLINASRLTRKGNRNLRDRYAEVEYMPDLSTPLAPTASVYHSYLDYYNEYNKNDNLNHLINGYLGLHYDWKGLYLDTRLQLDYNTNSRHVYWPSELMESVSFVSDYSGYNRRLSWNSKATYQLTFQDDHSFNFELQEIVQKDVQHYNYSKAYDGVDDTKPTTNGGDFQYMHRFSDKMRSSLVSTLFSVDYNYNDWLGVKALFRSDGASNVQKNNRWLFTPAFSANWNLKNHLFTDKNILSDWSIKASWARIGRFLDNNRFAAGPQYTGEELSVAGQPVVSSYYGYATIARPYNSGWIGYGMGWPYSDKWNVSTIVSLFNYRLNIELEYYNNTDCDLITTIPVAQEYGYKYQYMNGMKVRNSGVELSLSGKIFDNPRGLKWESFLGLAYNHNKLLKLPNQYDELVIGNRKLKVGHSIDEFWLYQNKGIYVSSEEVPSVDGVRLSMNSIPFSKNDPKWKDMDGNNLIDENDKVLKGHMLPPFTGNLLNQFKYDRFDLSVNLFFAFGHNALNYRSSQRYNFLALESTPSLESMKEIFFWQKTHDKNDYPIYNQMSGLNPYQAEQDLFLEKLWYLKLRSLTLGYTLPLNKSAQLGKTKKKTSLKDLYFYITANNLFTITDFSGDDPELVDFDGYYRGYGQPLSRSVVVGLKFNF